MPRMTKRLFLGKLSSRCHEDDIRDLLEPFGRIDSISLKPGFAFVDMHDERDAKDAVNDLQDTRLCGERMYIEFAKGTPHVSYFRFDFEVRQCRCGFKGRDLQKDREQGIENNTHYGYSRSPPRRGGGRYGGGGGGGYGGGRDSSFRDHRSRRPSPPRRRSRSSNVFTVKIENVSSRVSSSSLEDLCRKYGRIVDVRLNSEDRMAEVSFEEESDAEYCMKKMDGMELKDRELKVSMVSSKRERSDSRSRSRSPRRSRSVSPAAKRGARSASRSRSRSGSKDKRDGSGSPNGKRRGDSSDEE